MGIQLYVMQFEVASKFTSNDLLKKFASNILHHDDPVGTDPEMIFVWLWQQQKVAV